MPISAAGSNAYRGTRARAPPPARYTYAYTVQN
eukprot:COSAG02_NODE_58047_length_278_cov_1.234637_2_plen_32_part_01